MPNSHSLIKSIAVLLIVAMSLVLFFCLPLSSTKEPSYKGKYLRDWLYQYSLNIVSQNPNAPDSSEEAERALRIIGTNALPYLVHMAQIHNSDLSDRIIALGRRHKLLIFKKYTEEENHIMSVRGFQALGSTASPAVGPLTVLLTNAYSSVRATAADALGNIGPSASSAIPTLVTLLSRPDAIEQANALTALAEMHEEPDVTIPAILNYLKLSHGHLRDRDVMVRLALNALQNFGIKAKTAVPIVSSFLDDSNKQVREEATNVLSIITPENVN